MEVDWQEIGNVLPSANLACNGRYPALYGIFYQYLQVKHVYLRNEPHKNWEKGV